MNLFIFGCTDELKALLMEQVEISKKLLIAGLVLLVGGFTLMVLGSDTYSFWKISVSPLLIIIAFCVIVWSVMHEKYKSDV